MEMLYRLRPPLWLNDAVMLAFGERLLQLHAAVRLGSREGKTIWRARIKRSSCLGDIAARLVTMANDNGVETVLLSVNFGNHQWCGIVVDVKGKMVENYDSLNDAGYKNTLDTLCWHIVHAALTAYGVQSLSAPIQFEAFSCGGFVFLKFWHHLDHTMLTDLSVHGLQLRRRARKK